MQSPVIRPWYPMGVPLGIPFGHVRTPPSSLGCVGCPAVSAPLHEPIAKAVEGLGLLSVGVPGDAPEA